MRLIKQLIYLPFRLVWTIFALATKPLRIAYVRLNKHGKRHGGVLAIAGVVITVVVSAASIFFTKERPVQVELGGYGDVYDLPMANPQFDKDKGGSQAVEDGDGIEVPVGIFDFPDDSPPLDELFTSYDATTLTGVWRPEKKLGYGKVRIENGEGFVIDGVREKVLEFRQTDNVIVGRVRTHYARWVEVHLHPISDTRMLTFIPVDPNIDDPTTIHWYFESSPQ